MNEYEGEARIRAKNGSERVVTVRAWAYDGNDAMRSTLIVELIKQIKPEEEMVRWERLGPPHSAILAAFARSQELDKALEVVKKPLPAQRPDIRHE